MRLLTVEVDLSRPAVDSENDALPKGRLKHDEHPVVLEQHRLGLIDPRSERTNVLLGFL